MSGDKAAAAETQVAPESTTPAPGLEQKAKKEKKETKKDAGEGAGKKKTAGGGNAAPVDEGEPVPSMIDLRVGHIIDGMPLPPTQGY